MDVLPAAIAVLLEAFVNHLHDLLLLLLLLLLRTSLAAWRQSFSNYLMPGGCVEAVFFELPDLWRLVEAAVRTTWRLRVFFELPDLWRLMEAVVSELCLRLRETEVRTPDAWRLMRPSCPSHLSMAAA